LNFKGTVERDFCPFNNFPNSTVKARKKNIFANAFEFLLTYLAVDTKEFYSVLSLQRILGGLRRNNMTPSDNDTTNLVLREMDK
jgi:hypothetical protein